MHDETQQCLNKIKRYQSDLIAGNYARVTVVAKCFFKVPILQISAGRSVQPAVRGQNVACTQKPFSP